MRALSAIVSEAGTLNYTKARECLAALAQLGSDDLAREDFRAAAQTFALLAVADALTDGSGTGLAEVYRSTIIGSQPGGAP